MTEAVAYAVAVHGGAGNDAPGETPPGIEAERASALREALGAAEAVLAAGGPAVDAVVRAVVVLEDCPLFNAGHGSVLAADGTAELDASVMDGATGRAGGVSTVKTVRNPVLAARAVMDRSPHAILAGAGAEAFAAAEGLALVENEWFLTPYRRAQLRRVREKRAAGAQGGGTVGCVARDRAGNLAAATSTGGIVDKAPGRVSDSAIPGAGTWAKNGVCAVSATGTGDIFIRTAAAHRIAALMEYRGLDIEAACAEALAEVSAAGGYGGVIGVDSEGRIAVRHRTDRMAWAAIEEGGAPTAEA